MSSTLVEKYKLKNASSIIQEKVELERLYNNYLQNIDNIASNYSLTKLLINSVIIDNKKILEGNFNLSNNFPDSFTTIKTNEHLSNSIKSGESDRINNYQTLISLCISLETFLTEILELLGVNINSINTSVNVDGKTMRNFIIMAIAQVHKLKSMESVFSRNSEDSHNILRHSHEYLHLNKLITLRNCMIHNQGNINGTWINKLNNVNYNNQGKTYITIKENEIDDMIHFFILPIKAFTQGLYEVIE